MNLVLIIYVMFRQFLILVLVIYFNTFLGNLNLFKNCCFFVKSVLFRLHDHLRLKEFAKILQTFTLIEFLLLMITIVFHSNIL